MTGNTTDQAKLAEKIAKLLADDGDESKPHIFDDDEVKTLQAVIAFVNKLQALKWFGNWVMWLVVALGTLIMQWDTIKQALSKFLS